MTLNDFRTSTTSLLSTVSLGYGDFKIETVIIKWTAFNFKQFYDCYCALYALILKKTEFNQSHYSNLSSILYDLCYYENS